MIRPIQSRFRHCLSIGVIVMAMFFMPAITYAQVPELKLEPIAPITLPPLELDTPGASGSKLDSPVAPLSEIPFPFLWSEHPAWETHRRLVASWAHNFGLISASFNPDYVIGFRAWRRQNNATILKQIAALARTFEKDAITTNPVIRELNEEEKAFLADIMSKTQKWEENRQQFKVASKEYVALINQEVGRQCAAAKSGPIPQPCPMAFDVAPSVPVPANLQSVLAYRIAPVAALEQREEILSAKIISISVSDKIYEAVLEKAEMEMRDAAYHYKIASQNEASARQRFRKVLSDTAGKIKTQSQIIDVAQKKLTAARRSNYTPDVRTAEGNESANARNIRALIAKEEATIARLNIRIDQVKAWGGDKTAMQLSLQTLADQIAKVEETIERLTRELREETRGQDPYAEPPVTAEIAALQREIEDAQRAIRNANIALDVSSETLFDANEVLQQKDQIYADSLIKVSFLKGKGAKQLLRVRTNYTFDARFTNRRAEMKDLNRAIKLSRQAVREADYQREKARFTMLEANEDTSNASENLEQAIIDSASSQLAFEALMQAKEGLDASKAGPGVFLLWASNRVAQNVFNPPKVYEPEYRLDGEQSVSQQILDSYFVSDAQQAAERLTKYGATKTYDHLRGVTSDTLKLGQIEKEMQKIVSQSRAISNTPSLGTKSLATLLTRFKAQEKVYDSAAKSLSAKLYGSGTGKFAAKVSWGLVESQLKSVGVEAIKRQLADFFEGHAWRAYMRANQRFVLSVRVFRASGNIYWRNRDTLDGLIALREEIKRKFYDDESKLQIEKSETFNLEDELRFWVSFVDENGEPTTAPHPGRVKLFLDQVQLVRKPNSDIYDLTRAGAKDLRKKGREELTLKIMFE